MPTIYATAGILPIVAIADGAATPDLKIEMRPLGTVSGRAFDEKGEPLTDVRVDAVAIRLRVVTQIASSATDDRGEFRISALEPGEYYIRVSPSPQRKVQNAFPSTYFPST